MRDWREEMQNRENVSVAGLMPGRRQSVIIDSRLVPVTGCTAVILTRFDHA
ncbi:hypothetical protein [Microvirga yunnanensis]|uniref:hypothetical protein n=1 Tax=Microvirga yunnanensis TaxID=2953740 RepID=UPI0021C85DB9|nr:hypothetical protein [Microvirga sp. HBU65207]